MKIISYNYNSIQYPQFGLNRTNSRQLFKPAYDTVCFKRKDFLDLPDEKIYKRIQESLTAENCIGEGCEAEVYKIKGTNFCVRIPKVGGKLMSKNFSKELSEIDKINHIRAKIDFGVTIMDIIKGHTLAKYKDNSTKRHNLQAKIAKMPIESFSDLLNQIANGINNEIFFDDAAGNLIINTQKNKLTAIDFYTKSPDDIVTILPLNDIYNSLTNFGVKPDIGKQIAKKIILAGLKELEPNHIPCMDVEIFDFDFLIDNIFSKNCKMIKTKIKELKFLKKKEITDKSIIPELESKLNQVRILLQRLK